MHILAHLYFTHGIFVFLTHHNLQKRQPRQQCFNLIVFCLAPKLQTDVLQFVFVYFILHNLSTEFIIDSPAYVVDYECSCLVNPDVFQHLNLAIKLGVDFELFRHFEDEFKSVFPVFVRLQVSY